MDKLYVQIINGIEYGVCLGTQKEIRDIVEGDDEYNGVHYSRKKLIVISDDLDYEQSLKTFAHEYVHAHRFALGYDIGTPKEEDAICDYIGANYNTIYHMTEHFGKHISKD